MSKITGLATAGVQVENYKEGLCFYETYLGFEKKQDMGDEACWGKIGDMGLYIEGGAKPKATEIPDSRITLILSTENITTFFDKLKKLGVTLDEDLKPLTGGKFWFRFRDSSGNILEAAGPKI
jgi:predicted enzyme related to lactoylglutathione lyase